MSNPVTSPALEAAPALAPAGTRPLHALLNRLHLYVGLFVGPFIFVAALSGLLYALTPQLESWLYADQLFTDSIGPIQPLARQIDAARSHIGEAGTLSAVRPSPELGSTTRVIFTVAGLTPSGSKAVFIDPVTAEVRGELMVYGTSGVLPLRTWIDHFHRSLLLGEPGRVYSELAASWLWIAALSGLFLWSMRRRQRRTASAISSYRRRHASLGLVLLAGLLIISVTGLTWSRWAGANIGVARAALGMSTPKLSTQLEGPAPVAAEHAHHPHAEHGAAGATNDLQMVDVVLGAARAAGIDAGLIEIRSPVAAGRAWTVSEIDRRWPTQVDAVAIDPRNLAVVDRIEFAHFPLAAKLTRWGIDVHMGVLFGLPNQLVLVALAAGLLTLIIWGYRMWWQRRSAQAGRTRRSLVQAARQLSLPAQLCLAGIAAALGYGIPALGVSLLVFVVFDVLAHALRRRPA